MLLQKMETKRFPTTQEARAAFEAKAERYRQQAEILRNTGFTHDAVFGGSAYYFEETGAAFFVLGKVEGRGVSRTITPTGEQKKRQAQLSSS